ncbi:hypothetical protein BH10BAC1_BH10BAC1_13310 [soil metagenome]
MKRAILYLFLLLFCVNSILLKAQNSPADSLLLALKTSTQDTTRLRLRFEIGEACSIFRLGYWDSIAIDAERLNCKKIQSNALNNIGYIYYNQGITDKALNSFRKSLLLQEELNDKNGLASTYNNMGALYESQSNNSMAINYYQKSLVKYEEAGNKKGTAITLNNIGLVFNDQGIIERALDCFSKSLKIYESLEDKNGIANATNSIAIIYDDQKDYIKAITYYNKSLKIYEEINNKNGIALVLTNLATYYKNKRQFQIAFNYYSRALKIRQELGNKRDIAFTMNGAGNLFLSEGKISEALEYFNKSLMFQRQVDDKRGIASSYNYIGQAYYSLVNTEKTNKEKNIALSYLYTDSSLVLSKKIGYVSIIFRAERVLSKLDSAKGNFKGSFEHYKQFIFYRDSVTNESTRKASLRNELKYEFEKKEAVINEQQEKERTIAQEKNRFQLIIIGTIALGLILVIVLALFILRSLKATRLQKLIIEEKQHEILASIHYAKRIQKSLLPTEKYIENSITRLNSK